MYKFKRSVAVLLLLTQSMQIMLPAAASMATSPELNEPQQQLEQSAPLPYAPNEPLVPEIPESNSQIVDVTNPATQLSPSIALSTNQLGMTGPVSAGVTYSDLTGTYFTGQILKEVTEDLGFNILGEYGDNQYRINGTLGLFLTENTMFKISAEQFAQRLPFSFTSGDVEERIKQNAVGMRLQQSFDIANVSLGAYAARSLSKKLSSIAFNCSGIYAGFTCINERNIAGANSAGADIGVEGNINLNTHIEGKLYYDRVRYNTIFTPYSQYDTNGLGGGLYVDHLFAPNFKFSGGAEARKIYDTYDVALSWMPPLAARTGIEFSLIAQHVQSRNETPDNNSIGLKVAFLADRLNYQTPMNSSDTLASWLNQPAVKMNQVLAVAEEYVHLAAMMISSITPNFGTLFGGNIVTITGINFPAGSIVQFGQNAAIINSLSPSSITVIVPPGDNLGAVNVYITTPAGEIYVLENGYFYGAATGATGISESIAVGPTAGGTSVTLQGTNFVTGDTSVTIGGIVIPASAVTVNSPTSLTFTTPAHAAGTVMVSVSTSLGSSGPVPGGFTYVDAPTAGALNPNSGPLSGGSTVVVTGTNFVTGYTSVTFDGTVIPAGSVTVTSANSLSFTTPTHAAGTVAVSVTTPGGTANVPGGFIYSNTAPMVSLINPPFGASAGGTSVIINGANFQVGSTSVTIGGTTVLPGSVTVSSPSSLTFLTPAHAQGNVSVNVTTAIGSSGFVPGGFTYEDSPIATSITPSSGPTSGETVVTITGMNFVAGDTFVNIDQAMIPATSVIVNSSTSLTFTTPTHSVGNVAVTVTTAGGMSSDIAGGYTYENAPTATSLMPLFGSTAGGTSVTVTGTDFVEGSTSVSVGGIVIPSNQVSVSSANSLTFSTPAHDSGNVAVTVMTAGGTSSGVPGGFTYEATPTVTSLTPAFGPSAGNTSVTITGTNFVAGNTAVLIDGTALPASSVTVNSATSLTFTTPTHAAGNIAVTVMTAAGTSGDIPGGFTYEDVPTATSLTPAFGPSSGGTSVTITGTNFVPGDTSVTIGGMTVLSELVNVTSATSLTFSTPAQTAGNVAVTVATSGGTTSNIPGGFTYEDVPTATSLMPTVGSTSGNTSVTITGTNFVANDTTVMIGGAIILASSVTVNSPTSLTFTAPPHAADNVPVSVKTSAGTTSNIPGGFTYSDAAPTATSLTPPFGSSTNGTSVAITGTNFVVGNTYVNIGTETVSAAVTSPISLTFITPQQAPGNVNVSVTTPVGTSGFVPGGFTYENTPTATSLNPTSGTTQGETAVTITGTGFVAGDTTVIIDTTTIPANLVTVNSSTSLTFSTPVHAAANVPVKVSNSTGTSSDIPGGYTYSDNSPTVTSLSPPAGTAAGGTSVTIRGTNFVVGNTSVKIDMTSVSPTMISSTSLTFTTPSHTADNVNVSVTTPVGTSGFVPGGYTYEDTPTAASLTPAFGPEAGGTTVTITGTHFVAGDTRVMIGGVNLPTSSVTVNSATSLTFTTPGNATAGVVAVSVTTSGGTSADIPGGFTYEAVPTAASLTPPFGSVAGGIPVTISGTNFVVGDTTVNIGGIMIPTGSVAVNSANSLTFTTPAYAAGNVAVSVATSAGTSSNIPGGFTYEAVPTATSLTPAFGPLAGETSVTITGTNFVAGDTTVTIGGTTIPTGSVTVNSATSLTFSTPVNTTAGNVNVSVNTAGGASGNILGGFTYVDVPTATSLSPTSGTTAGGTAVVITGTNFVPGNTTVTIGGNTIPAGSVMVSSPTSLTFSTPNHAAGNVAVIVTTPGGTTGNIPGGYTYLAPSLSSCSAPIPSFGGIQLLTCVGANLTLFDTTFLKASGSTACSTFPTKSIVPAINVLGDVLITATDIPSILSQGLIGCDVQVCSDESCSVLGGVAGPVVVTLGL